MRKKIFTYMALVLLGVTLFLSGFILGEFHNMDLVSRSYFQGYTTGYLKSHRRIRRELMEKHSININALKLGKSRWKEEISPTK